MSVAMIVSLLLMLSLAAGLRAERTEVGPGVCHPDCTKHGNCNSDTGECICRYGWIGKACEVDALSACRIEPDGPATCGWHKTMNCHCFRQCKQFHCRDGVGCERSIPPENRGCYIQEGVPLQQQRSKPPDAGEAGFKYFKGWQTDVPEAQGSSEIAEAMAYGDFATVGLSNCPKSCNHRGLCYRLAKKADAPASCVCMRGYKGASCEEEDSSCVLGCSGRGKCLDKFFCHCQPPYFGHGCMRDGSVAPAPSRPSPVQLKIYMYELPTHIAYPVEEQLGEPREELGGGDYAAYMLFMEQFLTSSIRAESPESAHLFFVEPYTYSVTKMVWDGNERLANVLGHIRASYKFWNRTQGRDHFLWAPQDRGGCHLTGLALQPIKIMHFGMHSSDVQKAKISTVRQRGAKGYGCYHPMRDIVAVTRDNKHKEWAARSNNMTIDNILRRKTKLIFWNGGSFADHTTPEAAAATGEFSGGSRQILDRLDRQWKDPDINLVVRDRGAGLLGPQELEDAYRAARFCFAPYGWGNRLAQAIVCNCIPVIVQEQVFQAYDDLLEYESFCVRLTNRDLPMLREILRNISDAQYRGMMQQLIKYRDAFNWFTESGGRAFDFTIASLRRRHQNLKALLY